MSYQDHLDEVCEEQLSSASTICEVFSELPNEEIIRLANECQCLRSVLIESLKKMNYVQDEAHDREGFARAMDFWNHDRI